MKRVSSFALAMVLLLMCVCGGCAAKLTEDEQRVATIVDDLVNMMKDPDSFELRDDIVVIYAEDTDIGKNYFTYVTYSANNSYGASLVDTAVFMDNQYLGSMDDDIDIYDNPDEQLTFVQAKLYKSYWDLAVKMGADPTENHTDWISAETISMQKIADNLKINYVK